MKHNELKHRVDGAGRFKLQWNWVPTKENPNVFYFNRWLTFNNQEDAVEYYEHMIKGVWPDYVKWEIVDVKAN